jgi:CHASE3 domain sensor protein
VIASAIGLIVAVTAVLALRAMTEHHEQTRREGLLLADIERLRFNLEERVATSRGFLVTRDQTALVELGAMREKFAQRLRALAAEHPGVGARLDAITKAESAYHDEILATNQLRANTPAGFGAVFETVRARLRAKRELIEGELENLSREGRSNIDDAVASNERIETRVSVLFIGSSIILAIATFFGIAITRRLRQALNSEIDARAVAERLAEEVFDQSKQVEHRLREVSAELEALKARSDAQL